MAFNSPSLDVWIPILLLHPVWNPAASDAMLLQLPQLFLQLDQLDPGFSGMPPELVFHQANFWFCLGLFLKLMIPCWFNAISGSLWPLHFSHLGLNPWRWRKWVLIQEKMLSIDNVLMETLACRARQKDWKLNCHDNIMDSRFSNLVYRPKLYIHIYIYQCYSVQIPC